jgi:hypothetical protein
MGDPTSSYATAGRDLEVSGALKPHHHDKAEIILVGLGLLDTGKNYGKFHTTLWQ